MVAAVVSEMVCGQFKNHKHFGHESSNICVLKYVGEGWLEM